MNAVVREAVPGVQLEVVIMKKSLFDMGGLGGLAASARDECMVLVPLANGDMQDGVSNAIIGGKHESFPFFANTAGGVIASSEKEECRDLY